MQHEITSKIIIPDKSGHIPEPGWARRENMIYTRENIQAKWYRKKEWDYYLFTTDTFGVAFTVSDLGYIGMLSASFLDFENAKEHTKMELALMPRGRRFGLGAAVSAANAECHTGKLDMTIRAIPDGKRQKRHISCNYRHFDGRKDLTAELDVYEPDMEPFYIATPWKENPCAFYYNCKWNCLEAEGVITYGDRTEKVTRKDCLGVLDWGRGVWTYDNTWFWGTGSGRVGGEPFGLNLGYGFSDRSAASENAVCCRGKIHKLNNIVFEIPKTSSGAYDFLSTWKITSDDDRFSAYFEPILNRHSRTDLKIIVSEQNQVFGRMNGEAVLDSGETVAFSDFICALEVVRNKY